jgi:hypothetical protein
MTGKSIHQFRVAENARRLAFERARMTGKFLPFKYYGATGKALAYGLKEE